MRRKFVYLVFDNVEPGGAGSAPAAVTPPAADDTTPDPAAPDPADLPPAADDDGEPLADADGKPILVPLAKAQAEKKRRKEAEAAAQTAREETAYYRGLAENRPAAPAAAPPAPPKPAGPPTPPVKPLASQFDEYSDFEAADELYQDAREQYIIDKTKYEVRQDYTTQQQQSKQQQTDAQIGQAFQERLAAEAALDPDIVNLANTFHMPGPNQLPLTGPMQDAIRESDVGPKLLRFFANNKPEVMRLAALSPVTQLREIGRIEAGIINKPQPLTKRVTSAPDPIKPLGSGGTVEVNEDTMPMSEYLARERARNVERHKRS